ncbi:DedA family protein [Aliarcobacter cibarius]|jgi:membrane protein DedA with SNARE-associated domain|uniref:DedA family membrane protein, type III (SNARE domain) n=1 Tax=Aliarcobacter cibarius TaxID=255507 RepID=A0A5J6RG06_9BACT|nr:DedA family protein [Aliarcobacter cibarius]QEZ88802.1 DedA family membrane protein, type III (SNARE domain) [Aliarcobacter cibarius]QKJ26834.1 DedA family membrane protein, type III (SNARE domain) [Aliarcobacter cibarius]TLS99537.1 DedA family protein [Aliarcobacter cibarius]TLS99973.1 DedA family protein [Aliarcobacter cibarius]TLT03456.1 DedA family protein [Aliarcobacter cibarius]
MEQFIQDWGYIALFLYSFGGGFLALAIAGAFSYAGDLNIYITVIVAGVSNFIGSQFLFYFAKYNKSYMDETVNKHRRKVAMVKTMLKKYGSFMIFIQKYIYGVKTLVPLVMGISAYNPFKYTVLNAIASAIWAIVIGYISFTAGKLLLSFADDFKYVGFFTVLLVLGILVYSFKDKKKVKKQ